MANNEKGTEKFAINDRVKKGPAAPATCLGTVRQVRQEVTATNKEQKDRGVMYIVQWDNGTISYHGGDALIASK